MKLSIILILLLLCIILSTLVFMNYSNFKNEPYTNQKKMLIIMKVFFNYDFIERTIISINNQKNSNIEYDIIFLEVESKYSNKMKQLADKYKIYKHFFIKDNISNIITLFSKDYKNIINKYDFIALTEGDAVLDKECFREALYIINKYNFPYCAIDLYTNLPKYKKIQNKINSWVANPVNKEDYNIRGTGVQFMIFSKNIYNKLIMDVLNKKLISPIALGEKQFHGLSDSNIHLFLRLNNYKSVTTKYNKLDHIGWEPSIYNTKKNIEYKNIKKENVKKRLRKNIDISNYKLELIK
jgi:hypothetical protein